MIQQNKKGFTIIELLLAMTIVSVLMMTIAIVIMQMSSIMRKGSTMIELNTAGRSLNADFTKSFNSISTIANWNGRVSGGAPASGATFVQNADAGSFCSGDFSYLWNSAKSLTQDKNQIPVRYAGVGTKDKSIRLIRIRDVSKKYCSDPSSWTNIPKNQAVELLPEGETGLMLYGINFSLVNTDATSNQSLINIQYQLGTKGDDNRIDTVGLNCNPNNQFRDYCAINRFDLTVRTIGRR